MASDLSPAVWAATVLRQLGIHQTPGAVQALVGWSKAEGGHWNNDARYNPLNTTQVMPGAGNTGSQGNIKVYKNWQQGIDATVKTLRYGAYKGILRALRAGDPGAVAAEIGKTPWGTSGDLVARTIASTPKVSGVHAADVPGGSAGGGSSGAARSDGSGGAPRAGIASVGVADAAGGGAGLAQLLGQVQQAQKPQPIVSAGLQAPSFAAGPTLPQGYKPAMGGGGSPATNPSDHLASLLQGVSALQGAGPAQQTAAPAAVAQGGSQASPSGGPTTVDPTKTLTTTFGGVTENIKAGGIPKVGRAKDVKNLQGVVDFQGVPVAAWVGYVLDYAKRHGWKGGLTEGFRTDEQQTGIYNSGVRPAAKPKSLGGGGSNHSVQTYPGGAADVTGAAQLAEILRRSPYGGLLQWAGAKDPVHFSHPHGGSY